MSRITSTKPGVTRRRFGSKKPSEKHQDAKRRIIKRVIAM
jgi:hypothetical protein